MNKTALNSQKEKHSIANFYPRSPCGERLRARAAEGGTPEFSIHALLAESDRANNFCLFQLILFYPRSPYGERLRQTKI